MSAIIYKYYEIPYLVPKIVQGKNVNTNNYTYVCKWCKENNIINHSTNQICTANAISNTTSNLINHLKRIDHATQYQKYLDEVKEESELSLGTPKAKQRRLEILATPSRTLTIMGFVPYPRYSVQQIDRYFFRFINL